MRRALVPTATLVLLGALVLAGASAGSAQTGSEIGFCTTTTGTQDGGSVAVGQRQVIRLAPTCVFTEGAAITVTVNGRPVGTRAADARGGVSVNLNALSETEISVDGATTVPATCGPNAVVANGPSSVTGGVDVTQTATFNLVCPPPTTTTPPTAPAASTIDAVTPTGERRGPPGVGLKVSGAGYRGCANVYIYLDGVRIGTAEPGAAGGFSLGGLSVPGDTDPGRRPVTASCRASASAPRASTTFDVTSVDIHRTALETALPQPRHISAKPRDLAVSVIVAVLLVLLLAFPSELFNATLEENYDEVRGWFGLPARAIDAAKNVRRDVAFVVLLLVGGLIYSALNPSFGFNLLTLAMAGGIAVALFVMSVVFSLPADIAIHGRFREWGKLNILPGSILVAIVCVVLSRLLHFQPGYLYGVLAGLAFASKVAPDMEGRLTAMNWTFGLLVALVAWIARVPVSAAAAEHGDSLGLVALEACLSTIVLIGIETLVVAMLPMRFLDGRKVIGWNRVAWAVLFTFGLFGLVHVLLRPGTGYVGHTTTQTAIAVGLIYTVFLTFSVGFWAYFRYRPRRDRGARAAV